MLLFMDGFDHYDPQAQDGAGQPLLARGKADYLSPQASRVAGRRPSSSALCLPAGAGGGYVKQFTAKNGFVVGCAVRVIPYPAAARALLLGVGDATTSVAHLVMLEAGSGTLALYRSVGGSQQALAMSRQSLSSGWNHIEFKIVQGRNDGMLALRLNGTLDIRLAGVDTLLTGGPLSSVFLGALPGGGCPATLHFDDLYVADTAGAVNNDFLGNARVDTLLPVRDDGYAEWDVQPAGMAAWQALADGDESSAIVAAAGALDHTVAFQPLLAAGAPAVFGVQLDVLARKSDAGAADLLALAYGYSYDTFLPLTGWPQPDLQQQLRWFSALFSFNPDSGSPSAGKAFTQNELGGEQYFFGVRST